MNTSQPQFILLLELKLKKYVRTKNVVSLVSIPVRIEFWKNESSQYQLSNWVVILGSNPRWIDFDANYQSLTSPTPMALCGMVAGKMGRESPASASARPLQPPHASASEARFPCFLDAVVGGSIPSRGRRMCFCPGGSSHTSTYVG